MGDNLEKIDIETNKVENENVNSITSEEVLTTIKEVLTTAQEVLTTTEEIITSTQEVLDKKDKLKNSLFSIIKNYLFVSDNKEINLKEEVVINNQKLSDDEKINEEQKDDKIIETLDVLVEEIETRIKKTFVERILSFILRPCSA
jgi:hypothetical protein